MRRNYYHKRKLKNPKFDWRTIFQKNSGGFSSKRILAVSGFLLCCGIFLAGFILEKNIPDFGETLLICSISLYGVDALPNWSRSLSKEQ